MENWNAQWFEPDSAFIFNHNLPHWVAANIFHDQWRCTNIYFECFVQNQPVCVYVTLLLCCSFSGKHGGHLLLLFFSTHSIYYGVLIGWNVWMISSLEPFIPSLPYFLSALLWSFFSSSFSFYTTNFKREKPCFAFSFKWATSCYYINDPCDHNYATEYNMNMCELWYFFFFKNQDAKTYSTCFVKAEIADQLKVLNLVINNISAIT